jgi:hypothetical protein
LQEEKELGMCEEYGKVEIIDEATNWPACKGTGVRVAEEWAWSGHGELIDGTPSVPHILWDTHSGALFGSILAHPGREAARKTGSRSTVEAKRLKDTAPATLIAASSVYSGFRLALLQHRDL